MQRRTLPTWSDLRSQVRLRPVAGDAVTRRLARAYSIEDLRREAARRVPRSVLEFVDGGSEGEVSLRRARSAYERVELHPSVLRGVASADTATTVLGRPARLPLVLAPTGMTRLSHHEGEAAVARAAAASGVPYALSTMSSLSAREVAAVAPEADLWFQIYVMKDRELTRDLVHQAQQAGYRALVVTVDTPVIGRRLRDLRNGLTVPPELSPRTVLDIARRPRWWVDLLTSGPLQFATLPATGPEGHSAMINRLFDPSVTDADLQLLREAWTGPVVVKGIQSVADARRMVDLGADALVVSSHGGRQLDRGPTPLEVLADVVDEVGDRAEVLIDSGVRTGADVAAAVALGARAAMVGRPYLYGLMAGGSRGVETAVQVFQDELRRTLQLLGVDSVCGLGREHATLRPA